MESGPVRRFKINRLYGYKDVEIEFSSNALILIAGNGSGKTTILNALHAFLRRRFNRLQSLDFESIECDFSNSGKTAVLSKSQIVNRDNSFSQKAEFLVQHSSAKEDDLYEFLSDVYQPERGFHFYQDHPVIRSLYSASPFSFDDIFSHLGILYNEINTQGPELRALSEEISAAIQGVEVVYMPTYRRIENPLLSPRGKSRRALPVSRKMLDSNANFEPAHMNYGLEDVEARLNELSAEVERVSNTEYRSASAAIIDDALANLIAASNVGFQDLPDLASLTRFLLRVSRADRVHQYEASPGEADRNARRRIEAITELYESQRIKDTDQGVLRYFLARLGSVIEKTRETEAMLQRFVDACNSYLVDSSDEKSFVYEPNSMRVTVVNTFTESVVPLGQLSSGEKQVISILSRLYLYRNRNFILIDEPELSLSLEWQRKILPDMINSGSVSQLLAITHSPFIFENVLDPYAGSMRVTRHKRSQE